ncbi:hypothetical protein YC2023_120284 [Brassica napus]
MAINCSLSSQPFNESFPCPKSIISAINRLVFPLEILLSSSLSATHLSQWPTLGCFFSDSKSGRCSSVVEARLLRYWEADPVFEVR